MPQHEEVKFAQETMSIPLHGTNCGPPRECEFEFSSLAALEALAEKVMPQELLHYVRRGFGLGLTRDANQSAFQQLKLIPSVLTGVAVPDLSVRALDSRIELPIMVAPTAWHRLFCSSGELATLRACKDLGTNYILSCFSTTDFRELERESGQLSHLWYQMLPHRDLAVMYDYIGQAAQSGVRALVLTVDAVSGCAMCTPNHNQNATGIALSPTRLPLLPHGIGKRCETLSEYYRTQLNPSTTTWSYVERLIKESPLPVLLKGVMNPSDAARARAAGASGIIISNHGGRQLDGAISTIEALTSITDAGVHDAPNKFEVYVDGGIRDGAGVFKALSLGARAVLVGRPVLYGLAVAGEVGVSKVLSLLKEELAYCMTQTGSATLGEITRGNILER